MIDLYFWPTPNGQKISIALEELGLPYTVRYVDITRGDQFKPEFLSISPNNRMPAIVDHDPPGGPEALSVFESGAILLYLAERTGQLLPQGLRGRVEVHEWLMWQMGGLGPMSGQANHFKLYAPERIPYAITRYLDEVKRLYGVMNRRLEQHKFIAGEYSIADIAAYPWVVPHERLELDMHPFPHVQRWLDAVGARPAVQRGMAVGRERQTKTFDEEARKNLFGARVQGTE